MFKITLIIGLFIIINVQGDDEFCECSCKGTKKNYVGIPICDKITKECKCKPGCKGKNCEICTNSSDLTDCDCPNEKNECIKSPKFTQLLKKYEIIKNTDFNSFKPNELTNITEINDLTQKIDDLYKNLNQIQKPDLNNLKNIKKDAKETIKNLQDLLTKYKNEDLLQEDLNKLNNTLKNVEDLLKIFEDLNDYQKINELNDESNKIIKNIDDILNEEEKCLDVINLFCSYKNTSEIINDILKESEKINLEKYFNRIKKNFDDLKQTNETNEENLKKLNEINVPKVEFDLKIQKNLEENFKKLQEIKENINQKENFNKNASKIFDEVKNKKNESNIEKARSFNTIIMAPKQEIQDIIDNITKTLNISKLTNQKNKLEDDMNKIQSNITHLEEELKKIEDRKNKLVSDFDLYLLERDVKRYEEYIDCLSKETKVIDEEIENNNILLDELEKNLDEVEKLVEIVDKTVETVEILKEINDQLDDLEVNEDKTKTILCPKHMLV